LHDPIADRIPFFRQDYDRVKKEHLWANENVLFASYCSGLDSFGYVTITTDRLIHVLFAAEKGFFASQRDKCKAENWQASFYNIPTSPLTPKELAGRYVEEIPLNTILSVQRCEMKEHLNGRPLIQVNLSMLAQKYPHNLFFYDLQDSKKVHELLGTYATRREFSTNQPTSGASDIPSLLEALARLRASGVITDQEYQIKKNELLARM
jgi:hypothetical protein